MQRGVGVGALPGQGERDQARDGPAPTRSRSRAVLVVGLAELERSSGLHRAPPHVDRLVEDARRRPARGGAAGAGRSPGGRGPTPEDRRRAERAGGEDDLRRPDDQAGAARVAGPRAVAGRDRPPATPDADRRPPSTSTDVTAAPLDDPRPGRDAPSRDGPAAPTASSRAGSRTGSCRSRRSRWRCAGSAPPPSRAARRRAGSPRPSAGRRSTGATPSSRLDRGDVVVPLGAVDPVDAVLAGPLGPDVGRHVDARHPVHDRPAADRPAGEHRHRPVPRRQEPVVEVQLVDTRRARRAASRASSTNGPASSDDDRPAGPRQLRGDDAAARPRPDDHDVGLERDRSRRRSAAASSVGADRRRAGRSPAGRRADSRSRRSSGLPAPERPGVGVGEERQQRAVRV